jgi:hypothetical protein
LFHTNLKLLLSPLESQIQGFKWCVSDLELNTNALEQLPVHNESGSFLITAGEMERLRNSDTQIIWGVFCGIPAGKSFTLARLPYAEGNNDVWKPGHLQVPESLIEIVAWDSSYTIAKFASQEFSDLFKDYFPEAEPLD